MSLDKLEEVESFTYFGSLVTATGGADEDVKPALEKIDIFLN